jgi:hypothetical protein
MRRRVTNASGRPRNPGLLKFIGATLCGLLLTNCITEGAPRNGSPETDRSFPKSGAPKLEVRVMNSSYGALTIATEPGASCRLEVTVDRGTFGEGPPSSVEGSADRSGTLALQYPAPQIPPGRGRHFVTCDDVSRTAWASADFEIASGRLDPRGLHVRLERVEGTTILAGATTRLDPSLVPARDEIAAYLATVLEDEWRRATRGLGSLTLVGSSADVVVYVLPGRGTSLNERSSDGTERVVLYVADGPSTISTGKSLSVALHELGHTWCCFGPGAGSDEHWLERTPAPELAGVNRFGLMVHPVACRTAAGREVCATRFSDRELRAMGFADVPMPLADDCSTELGAADAEISSLDRSLAESGRVIDSENGTLASLVDQLRAMESQYPEQTMPPDARAVYRRTADTYDGVHQETSRLIAEYNATVQSRNATAVRRAALPC